MLKILTLPLLLTLAFTACKTKPLVEQAKESPHHPNNTDTYWAKGSTAQEVSAKLDLTSGVIEFGGKEGKKGFTKSMPFGQIQPGTYKFVNAANEELVYQSGANTITMSFSSPSSSLYLPLEGYRIMETMQPTLEVHPGNFLGTVTPAPSEDSANSAPLPTPDTTIPSAIPAIVPPTPVYGVPTPVIP